MIIVCNSQILLKGWEPMKVQRSAATPPAPASVRIRGDQHSKLKQLVRVTKGSSENGWVQHAIDNFLNDEWQPRMDAALKLEQSLSKKPH